MLRSRPPSLSSVASAVLFVALGISSACSDDKKKGSESCEPGTEGCDCYGNDTCDDDLSCLSGLCVDAGEGNGAAGSHGGDDSSGAAGDEEPAAGSGNVAGGGAGPGTGAAGSSGRGENGGAPGSAGAPPNGTAGSDDPAGGSNSGGSNSGGSNSGGSAGAGPEVVPPAGSPVATHGQLSVQGTHIVDEHGDVVQLKGVSSMWLNWDAVGYAEDREGMQWMRDEWGMTVFRAAMGAALPEGVTGTDDTYSGNPERAEAQVRAVVENALDLGVYVIIDWHDHEAHTRQAEAESFFAAMARDYGRYPNVLYEIYNEPLDVSWSSMLKPYHQAVSTAIRAQDPDNIVILGTPNWSQDVDVAAQSPLSGTNLMYTLHFYACTHGAELRAKAQEAYSAGLPLFVTEWGAADADGGVDGIVCESAAATWLDWLDARSIGWAAWKLDGCTDSTCFFKDQTVPSDGGWTSTDLNGHAEFVISRMSGTPNVEDPPDDCTPTGTCAAGDGLDCADGELIARDCSGCALLSCGVDCCDAIGHFGAVTYPDFLIDMGIVTDFVQSADAVEVSGVFTSGNQMAAIAFALSAPQSIYPYDVSVSMTATGNMYGDVTASFEDGEAGCLYYMYGSGGVYYPYYEVTCWGGFDSASPVRQINVRLEAAEGGTGTLTVTGVAW